MTFRPQEFRAVIINDEPKIFKIFLKKLLWQFRESAESVYVIRVVTEVGAILKDHDESPIMKFKTIKVIMYLLIMGEPPIYEMVQDEVYPLLRNACLYNRSHPLLTRGSDFFKNNKYNSIATPEQKLKIKAVGCKFIAFSLECIFTLASWFSKDPNHTTKQSKFSINYKMLLKENVVFPEIHEFSFFTEERIGQMENQMKKCQQQLESEPLNTDSEYFAGLKSRNDAEMMNGVEYLQQKLRQKEKLISAMKNQHSANDVNKESIIQSQKQQEHIFLEKVLGYEQKINELTEQVREYKYLLKKFDFQQLNAKDKRIEKLEKAVEHLSTENKALKKTIQNQSRISFVSNSSVQQFNLKTPKQRKLNAKNNNGLKMLLQLQSEPKEFQSAKLSPYKQQFFQYKEIKDCLYPFYDSLSKEQQIRLKKSLLKYKQILHKTKELQVGTCSVLSSPIQIQLTLIVTNLHQKCMFILELSLDYPRQTTILREQGLVGKKKLRPNEQYKELLRITVNDIDSRCIMMVLDFHYQGEGVQQLGLILPVTKLKLIRPLNYTSHSSKQEVCLERLIIVQKRILGNIQKLRDYFGKCFVEHQKTGSLYHLKFQLLQTTFFLSFNLVGEETLRLNMRLNPAHRCLAQKILNQFMFVLAK